MARAQRYITQNLRAVHLVLELVDARLPRSSRHRWMARRWTDKAHVVVMTRADLADPRVTARWRDWLRDGGSPAVAVDLVSSTPRSLLDRIRDQVPDRIAARLADGQSVRAMVVGLPNVGKSTFINTLSGRGSAPAGRQPGVTRGQQWIRAGGSLRLLDLPGILPPDSARKREEWYRLAAAGLVPPQAADQVETALWLLGYMIAHYPSAIINRYRVDEPYTPLHLLDGAGRRLGCLGPGGAVDQERAASAVLTDYQEGRLGRATLEVPGEEEES